MPRSEQINELTAALAKAAVNFPPIPRGCTAKVVTKQGSTYSYDYADLDDVLSAVRKPLAEQGLTLAHDHVTVYGEKNVVQAVVTTVTLWHASGQWRESSPMSVPCDGTMSPAQLVGSACTYGRRYTTQAILGLSTEQDDDGNAAGGNDAQTGKKESLPACPQCGKTTSVIVSKEEFGGGYYCFPKKLGCGNKWHEEKAQPPLPEEYPPEMEILENAAKQGTKSLEGAWKGLSADAKKACQPFMPAVKDQAKARDKTLPAAPATGS